MKSIAWGLIGALACGEAAAQVVRDATKAEVEAIQKSLERELNDAQSARFDSVKLKGEYFCGLVNAKNKVGAYVGYQPFQGMVFKGDDGKLVAVSMGLSSYPETNYKMCAEKGIQLPML